MSDAWGRGPPGIKFIIVGTSSHCKSLSCADPIMYFTNKFSRSFMYLFCEIRNNQLIGLLNAQRRCMLGQTVVIYHTKHFHSSSLNMSLARAVMYFNILFSSQNPTLIPHCMSTYVALNILYSIYNNDEATQMANRRGHLQC